VLPAVEIHLRHDKWQQNGSILRIWDIVNRLQAVPQYPLSELR